VGFRPHELVNFDPSVRKSALRVIRSGRSVTDEEAASFRPIAERTGRTSVLSFPFAIGMGLLASAQLLNAPGMFGSALAATLIVLSVTAFLLLKRDTDRCRDFLERNTGQTSRAPS
jgi:hypothetical protein